MSELRAQKMVLERITAARKLGSRYHAEADGLLRALCADEPAAMFTEATWQEAYLRGFSDGREILRVETPCEAAGKTMEHPAAHGY